MGIADARGFRRVGDIAEQADGRPEPRGVAVDRADDRLLEIEDVVDQAPDAIEGNARTRWIEFPGIHRFGVSTRAERFARPRQDDDPDIVIGGDVLKNLLELAVHGVMNRVAPFGPVEGHGGDAVVHRHIDELVAAVVFHGFSPREFFKDCVPGQKVSVPGSIFGFVLGHRRSANR